RGLRPAPEGPPRRCRDFEAGRVGTGVQRAPAALRDRPEALGRPRRTFGRPGRPPGCRRHAGGRVDRSSHDPDRGTPTPGL
ncbi:uncharacterized protein METZ01_LOCUS355564, partial [marine metagenome]